MRETIQNANGKQFHAVSLSGGTLTDILGVTGAVVLIVGNLWLTKKNPKHVLVQNAEAE